MARSGMDRARVRGPGGARTEDGGRRGGTSSVAFSRSHSVTLHPVVARSSRLRPRCRCGHAARPGRREQDAGSRAAPSGGARLRQLRRPGQQLEGHAPARVRRRRVGADSVFISDLDVVRVARGSRRCASCARRQPRATSPSTSARGACVRRARRSAPPTAPPPSSSPRHPHGRLGRVAGAARRARHLGGPPDRPAASAATSTASWPC